MNTRKFNKNRLMKINQRMKMKGEVDLNSNLRLLYSVAKTDKGKIK